MGRQVNVTQDGKTYSIDEGDLPDAIERGFVPETTEAAVERVGDAVNERMYTSPVGKGVAGTLAFLRGGTLGLSDAALATLGAGEDIRALRDANPITSTGFEVLGALASGGTNLPGGIASKVGARVGRTAEGASAAAQIARTGAGTAVEGAIQGAGQGVSQLALSADPLTIEHVASVMGSNVAFGAGTGGAIGVAGKSLEVGLRRAKGALDDFAAKGMNASAEVGDDLAALDTKGLRAAEKTEIEAIETARVPQRAAAAEDLKAFRKELKDNKLWLATKGSEDAEIRAIGKRTLKADKSLDSLLDDPKALAENPKAALSQLRKQEAALDELVNKHGDKLRASFAADESGVRVKSLDYASTALERNRALQTKIAELSSKPTSTRLDQIADIRAGLAAGKKAGDASSIGSVLADSALGHAVGMAAGVPYLGGVVFAAKAASGVMKKLGADGAKAAQRAAAGVQTFLDVSKRVAPHIPVAATKILGGLAFGPSSRARSSGSAGQKNARGRRSATSTATLATLYKQRSEEISEQIEPMADGSLRMRPAAREQLAERLRPIAAVDPVLADRVETVKERGLAFLASRRPKRPDIAGVPAGPDRWQPSDMQMREWARLVHAVEDPQGVVERLAAGAITPEDVEAMKTVYPEMHADITRQIIEQLPTLRASLPYQRRLALSMFSGVAVDPAMDPDVLNILQSTFAREAGTEGGTMAPRAQAAFGSVSKPEPTPAQQRGA